jgi:serine/threonine protein kinase
MQPLFAVGDLIGDTYEVLAVLGRGTAGVVYKVRHRMLEKIYALKALDTSRINMNIWHRFQNEAKVISRINHANIVTVYNFGLHDNEVPFYVMDYVDGQDLSMRLAEKGPFKINEILPVFIQVCTALAHTHQKGIIHRDIKPENLLLLNVPPETIPSVKVVDFGIAKQSTEDRKLLQQLTSKGEVFGTPYYMSPEQSLGERIDSRSDIYSLGCTLYEAICGRPPFRGRNSVETMLMHQKEEPPSLAANTNQAVPTALEEIMQKMLAKAPADRYRSMDLLGRDLSLVLQGKDMPINPYGTIVPNQIMEAQSQDIDTPKRSRKSRYIFLSLSLGLILMISAETYVVLTSKSKDKLSPALAPAPQSQAITVSDEQHYDSEITALQETVPEIQKPGASENDLRPFTKITTIKDLRYRVFDFPEDITIGWIENQLEQEGAPVKAVGRLSFREDADLAFLPAKCLEQYSKYLKRFQPGDIDCVRLKEDQNSDKLLKVCATIPGITELKFYGCHNLTEGALAGLNSYHELTLIDGGYSSMTGRTLSKANILSNIQSLYFGGNKDIGPLTAALKPCRRLTNLNLDYSDLKDRDFENIAGIESLKILWLNHVPIKPANLKALSRLPHLEALDIVDCGITKEAIPILQTFPALKTLQTRSIEARLLRAAMPHLKLE